MSTERPLTLVGLVNPPVSRYAAGWSHPDATRDWLDARFYVDTARTMERGGFDLMFLPDALAVPEDGRGEVATTLRTGGKGSIQLDPLITLATVAAATDRIGLGATVSTSFLPPYQIARSLLTLDHLSGGRCAWNIVTSTTDAEARNMGHPAIASRDDRYDLADAVVAQVLDLMTTWSSDALRLDTAAGVFADPDRIRRAATGLAPGPLTLPRSRQGTPVRMQAGASPRGKAFASRWAEIVFLSADGPEQAARLRSEIRSGAAAAGRNPDDVLVCAALQPVVGATAADARRVLADLEAQLNLDTALQALGRLLHADPAELDPRGSAVALLDAHRGATGSLGFEDMLRSVCATEDLDVEALAVRQSLNQLTPQLVGSGEEIAEELCRWQDLGAADGFVVTPAFFPHGLDSFVEHVTPALRRRGRLRSQDGGGQTLRQSLFGTAAPVE